MKDLIKISIVLVFIFMGPPISANVRLPKVIGNNMVLQQGVLVPIWGWASPGESVIVSFNNQSHETVADENGYWSIKLAPLNATWNPAEMTITGRNTVILKNVLVGEVWLCSGQSNMEYTMKRPANYAPPKKGVDSTELDLKKYHPGIRVFLVEKVLSTPDVTSTGWNEAAGKKLERFSAAGFYFAKRLGKELGVPIGIISSAWGGSRIEPWTPAEAYRELPAFSAESTKSSLLIDGVAPGNFYYSMIKPLAPFAIRGFLWYQGESNCIVKDGVRYADKMQALIEGWRTQWGSDKLPFYSVQIAPHYYTKRDDCQEHTAETLAEFWEGQELATKIPYTGIVATTDLVDDLNDIHPSYKWEIGNRLAQMALSKDYGKRLLFSGPIFNKMKLGKRRVIVSFSNVRQLKSIDGLPISCFSLADERGTFVDARAEIKRNKVLLSSGELANPTQVRFAWTESARSNLVNEANLPTLPFRSNKANWKYTAPIKETTKK